SRGLTVCSFQAEDGIRVFHVTGVQTCALPICRMLKSNVESSHIPVILLTAKNSVNDRIDCYNAGADAYISKPFDLKVLEARINNFIAHKRKKQIGFKTSAEIKIGRAHV